MNSQIEYFEMRNTMFVDNVNMMLGEEIPLPSGDILVVEQIMYQPHSNVDAALMDNRSGMCVLLIEKILDDSLERCIEMVRRYKMLGVEAELANIIVSTNSVEYDAIVIPIPYGCNLFSTHDPELAMRAVEKIVECGFNPMIFCDNEAVATCNLIQNLKFAVFYCREEDRFTFATHNEMSLLEPEHRQEVLCYARYLINKLF